MSEVEVDEAIEVITKSKVHYYDMKREKAHKIALAALLTMKYVFEFSLSMNKKIDMFSIEELEAKFQEFKQEDAHEKE